MNTKTKQKKQFQDTTPDFSKSSYQKNIQNIVDSSKECRIEKWDLGHILLDHTYNTENNFQKQLDWQN